MQALAESIAASASPAEADGETMKALLDQAVSRLVRLPVFSASDYAALNADVAQAGMNLAEHALLYGCAERRQIFRRDQLARSWGEAIARTSQSPASAGAEQPAADLPQSVSVFVSSWSEPAIGDLAKCLVQDLTHQGATATIETERTIPGSELGAAIVVAPHDFFRLGFGPAWRKTALPRSALMLNTASLASDAFAAALPYLLASRGVLDLSPQIADIIAQAGIPALQIRPRMPPRDRWLEDRDADHPLVRALPAEARRPELVATDSRPIDVSFVGRHTPTRSAFLARITPELRNYKTFFQLQLAAAELIDQLILTRAHYRFAGHLAARSKIALHVAEDEFDSLDWQMTFQAMAGGAVVVTDTCPPHGEFKAGVHLFQDDSRHLPDVIRWLLEDPDGRAAADAAQAASQGLLADFQAAAPWPSRAAALWATP
ncbi:hypothetical protein [Lichenifustis flavocetrariae]|uniref:Uncharacterized protein n=1 Tax=Lichenifustis flavocetrariae TaxID=2949735 RepID=A0AA41Z8S1_9HYPH|nr:hypothetical protein [Lichenifustis flavocetrariae]MCW6511427.1 hypothetical protein [Lichenifustis flavocetrariae]